MNTVEKCWSWVRHGGRLEIGLLLLILGAAGGLWTFVVLAEHVVGGDPGKFDEHLLVVLRQPGNLALPIGPMWTLQVAKDLTAFGGGVGIGLITLAVSGYLALQRRFGLLSVILTSVVGGTILSLILKQCFHRPRPEVVPHLTDIATSSFPSGHSMISSVVYLTLAALLARAVPDLGTRIYLFALAVLLVLLIGFSRIYLGVHYPTDVLAGWGIGSAWAIVCCGAAHFLAQRRQVTDVEKTASIEGMPRKNLGK